MSKLLDKFLTWLFDKHEKVATLVTFMLFGIILLVMTGIGCFIFIKFAKFVWNL